MTAGIAIRAAELKSQIRTFREVIAEERTTRGLSLHILSLFLIIFTHCQRYAMC